MNPLDKLKEHFSTFLIWSKVERERDSLSGDPLSEFAADWKFWLLVESSDQNEVAQNLCGDTKSQKDFIDWLGEQVGLQGDSLLPVRFQLARCEGFKTWEILQHHQLEEYFRKFGVYGIFLAQGQRGNPEQVKLILAQIVPETSAEVTQRQVPAESPSTVISGSGSTVSAGRGDSELHVLPVNFKPMDDSTKAAMKQAAETALEFLTLRRLKFLIVSLFAGDLIFLSLFRAVRIWWHTRGLFDRIKKNRICIFINSASTLNVNGGSLGLATCLAILMALGNLPEGFIGARSKKFLSRFIPRFFSSLSNCAFTGEVLKKGHLGMVEGIPEKIEALNRHEAIRRGVLPRENHPDSRGIISTKPLVWGKSVSQVLWRILPFRPTWVIANVLLLLSFVLSPYVYDMYIAEPPNLVGVGSSIEEFVKADYFLDGCPVRQFDQIKVYIGGDRGDRKTVVKITAHPPTDEQVDRFEPLRKVQENGKEEEWHRELTLPVEHGLVFFNYQYPPESEANYATVTIRVFRLGRRVAMKNLTLIIR